MALRDDLVAAIRARYAAGESVAQLLLDAGISGAIDDMMAELAEVIGQDALDDPQLRHELTREFMQGLVEQNVELAEELTRADEILRREVEGTDPIAFVYIGPDDASNRPFCNALEFRWLRRGEIDRLDNGQIPDAWVSKGGYNCRHDWFPLFTEDELQEFERGSVERANSAARR